MSSQVLTTSKEEDFTNSLENLFQCLTSLAVNMFKWNSLYFNLCPLPLVLSLGTSKKSLAPSPLLLALHQVSTHIDKILLSLPFSRLNSSSSLNLTSHDRYPKSLLTPVCPCLLHWGAQEWTPALQMCLSPVLSRGEGSPPLTCW